MNSSLAVNSKQMLIITDITKKVITVIHCSRIRYRSYYDYIKNGYSWKGLNQDSPWYEMDLDEFNARGGAKLIDMTKFYLIAKERPTNPMYNSPWKMGTYRVFKTDIYFDNGKKNRTTKEMKIFSRF